ncbi:unnamed protein product [Rotaria sp. Silwood2]|nr:unnamed protein product [Rotaria sp. Silwood2]CAF4470336.1 unnamed protein product [Rotaria sp. Silwood2]CAF4512558.1 unnamed protein product [Rotaria sp. Silwood2]
MSLSSAERFCIFKGKLNLEENKSLLAKFREKDAAWHRKYRQIINKHPTTLEKLREQNRKRQAKPIKNGIILQPVIQPRPTDISETTKNKVIQFYQLDEISSVATGKKDFVIIDTPDGSKVKVQKRHLVMTVQEVFEQFKLQYPNEKIGSTSFNLLRPKHVLPMSNIPQNVCLCKHHANIGLLLRSLSSILKAPKTTVSFREALVCDSNNEKCISSTCEKCGELKNFDKLFEYDDEIGGKDLVYHQWETFDSKIVKIEKSGTIRDAIDDLKSQTEDFLMHSFITHVQYIHFEDCKQNASPKSIVLQIDFSENFRTKYQDEVQNAFFNYKQAAVFNAMVCGYGRGTVDGVGGAVKRLVWKGMMAKQSIVRNANDFAHYATAVAKNINIIFVDAQDIKSQSSLLDQRWNQVRAVSNTLKIHYVKALSLYNIEQIIHQIKTIQLSIKQQKLFNINDDEIYLSQLTGPVTNKQPEFNKISNDKNELNNELLPNNNDTFNDMVDGASDYEQQQSFNKKLQLYRGTRSDDARKRRNRKRNLYFQMRRYRHFITRSFYCRFTIKLVRHILAKYNIHYIHVKLFDDLLIIDVKNKIIQQQNERRLPGDIFHKHYYYLFRHEARYF